MKSRPDQHVAVKIFSQRRQDALRPT